MKVVVQQHQYALARECQAEGLLDESLEIAMESSGDFVKKVLPDGKVVLVPDHANIERARLRISALHWMAAGWHRRNIVTDRAKAGDRAHPGPRRRG